MGPFKGNRATKMLDTAASKGYAVPAICIYNLEAAHAVLLAAKSRSSPSMLLLFPWALQYPALVYAVAALAHNSPTPCTLHLDHAQTPEVVKKAADLPPGTFDSIMVDMSHYSKDENLRLTRELTIYCHERGIAVEAEPGRIEGGEDGVSATEEEMEGVMTTREVAREFVNTGIDCLAPAFGNVHGKYGSRGIQLDYERLLDVSREVGKEVRLVLHGTDEFNEGIYKECVKSGMSKININRVVNENWREAMRGEGGLTEATDRGIEMMKREVEVLMDWCGSSGMAGRRA